MSKWRTLRKSFVLYLTHTSATRLLNIIAACLGYCISQMLKRPVLLGMPITVAVEPTTQCNLGCPDCPTGIGQLERNGGIMPLERFVSIVDEVKGHATSLLMHFQGEPMLHAHLPAMIEYASQRGLITELASNATLITNSRARELVKSGIKRLVVSTDSVTEETSGFYRRGAKLSQVVRGLEAIMLSKRELRSKYPLLIMELLVFNDNLGEIKAFKNLGKGLGVDLVRIKTTHVSDIYGVEGRVPVGSKYSRYMRDGSGMVIPKGSPSSLCRAPWTSLSVTHDGWIVPCCFDKSGYYPMGSLLYSNVREIWQGAAYNSFRASMLRRRRRMPVCSSCAIGRTRIDFFG